MKRGALLSPDTSQFSGTDHAIHRQLPWALPSGSLSIPSPPRHPHQHQPRLSHAHVSPGSPSTVSPLPCEPPWGPSTKGQTQQTSRILVESVGRGGFTRLVDEQRGCEGRRRGRELHGGHGWSSSRPVCRARAESCLISHPRRVRYHSP